jgi:HSP20 family molecular chaperone IbpA
VDIYETAAEFIVEIELPASRRRTSRSSSSSRVEVSGFKRELAAHAGSRYRGSSGSSGLPADVVVPGAVDGERAFAALENGVLTIVLKKPPRRRRDVEIKPRRDGA